MGRPKGKADMSHKIRNALDLDSPTPFDRSEPSRSILRARCYPQIRLHTLSASACFQLAEAVRFELTDGCPSPVFKSSIKSIYINMIHGHYFRNIWLIAALKALPCKEENSGYGNDFLTNVITTSGCKSDQIFSESSSTMLFIFDSSIRSTEKSNRVAM